MTFKQAVEEIEKGNKIKHKSWNSLMVTEFSNNIVCLEDERSYYYPYDLEDFSKAMLEQGYIEIETLEGMTKASFGDYIIKGIKGEFHACKPDIFQATYEEVR